MEILVAALRILQLHLFKMFVILLTAGNFRPAFFSTYFLTCDDENRAETQKEMSFRIVFWVIATLQMETHLL